MHLYRLTLLTQSFLFLFVPDQQQVPSPHQVSTTTEPTPRHGLGPALSPPNWMGNGTRSTGSVWPSRPGSSVDPNKEATSGTGSGIGLPGTRRRTVGTRQEGGGVYPRLYSSQLTCGREYGGGSVPYVKEYFRYLALRIWWLSCFFSVLFQFYTCL